MGESNGCIVLPEESCDFGGQATQVLIKEDHSGGYPASTQILIKGIKMISCYHLPHFGVKEVEKPGMRAKNAEACPPIHNSLVWATVDENVADFRKSLLVPELKHILQLRREMGTQCYQDDPRKPPPPPSRNQDNPNV